LFATGTPRAHLPLQALFAPYCVISSKFSVEVVCGHFDCKQHAVLILIFSCLGCFCVGVRGDPRTHPELQELFAPYCVGTSLKLFVGLFLYITITIGHTILILIVNFVGPSNVPLRVCDVCCTNQIGRSCHFARYG